MPTTEPRTSSVSGMTCGHCALSAFTLEVGS